MNQLDMMTTLVDAARQLPENKILVSAINQGDKRIEVLRVRYQKRGYGAYKKVADAAPPAPPRCPHCNCRMAFTTGDFHAESGCQLTPHHFHCESCLHNERA